MRSGIPLFVWDEIDSGVYSGECAILRVTFYPNIAATDYLMRMNHTLIHSCSSLRLYFDTYDFERWLLHALAKTWFLFVKYLFFFVRLLIEFTYSSLCVSNNFAFSSPHQSERLPVVGRYLPNPGDNGHAYQSSNFLLSQGRWIVAELIWTGRRRYDG